MNGGISVPAGAQICADTIYANNPGYGTLTLANSSCICAGAVIIPVEFLSLSAMYHDGMVSLVWRTASEDNCAGFEVQRGPGQAGNWTVAGYVHGMGNATGENLYSFEDDLPAEMQREPLLRYRLRQIDFDGADFYSPAVEVRTGGDAPGMMKLHAYPNPASDRVTVQYSLLDAMPARISVYSETGQEMLSFAAGVSHRGEHALSINTASMAPGIYLIELSAGETRIVRRFVLRR